MSAPKSRADWGLGCRVTRSPRLSEFLDGQLSAVHRAKVQAHIKRCDECREELRMLHLLSQRAATAGTRGRSDRPLSDVGSTSVAPRFGRDPALADRVLREVARRRGRRVAQLDASEDSVGTGEMPVRSWASRRAAAAAAAVLVCSLASGILGYSLGRQTPPVDQPNNSDAGPVYFVDTQNGGRAPAVQGPSAQDPDLRYPIDRSSDPRTRGKLRRSGSRWDQPIDAQPVGWRNR